MKSHLTPVSSNSKTGPVAVTTSSRETCPSVCPFRNNGCYADSGPLRFHWNKVTSGDRGDEFPDFLKKLRNLDEGAKVRLNQAGDLPGEGNHIDREKLSQIKSALVGKKVWTYTHKPVLTNTANAEAVRECNSENFVINLSANGLSHADKLADKSIGPVCTVLPSTVEGRQSIETPKGRRVVVCPATYRENITCESCMLCAWKDREVIVGFPAHGTQKKKVDSALVPQTVTC